MATLSYPGVYMEEVSSGVRPIAAASTSTAAFVGLTEKGPDDRAVRITNWTQFQKVYGTFIPYSYLAESVLQFFHNGGNQCYIVRVARKNAAKAGVTIKNRAQPPIDAIAFCAKDVGVWGNRLCLQIEDGTDDPGNTFKISIRKQEKAGIVPENFLETTPLEVHDNLSMDKNSPRYVKTVLKARSNLIEVDESDDEKKEILANNISMDFGIHVGGFVVINAENELDTKNGLKFRINIDNDGYQEVQINGKFSDLGAVATAITEEVKVLTKDKKSTSPDAFSEFECTLGEKKVGEEVKKYLILKSGTNKKDPKNEKSSVQVKGAENASEDISGYLKIGPAQGGYSQDATAVRRPANVPVIQLGDAVEERFIAGVTPGSDGDAPDETTYEKAFSLLDEKTDFSLLAVPGMGTTAMVDKGMGYCGRRPLQDVFYIGEMSANEDTPAEAETFRKKLTQPNSYGAVYFPWIRAMDPAGKSEEPILLPPSSYMAGLFARIDGTRGVWKAPAGTETSLSGAVGLAYNLTDVEQGNLNRINVNCIRRFPTAGIVSWGARNITSDPEWTYVPVRRMAIMLRVSIYNGIQWAVFEPNDEELWAQLRLNLNAFMMTLFRRGAFQGATPTDAFFIKCDGETTSQEDISLGIVNVLVGFAPLKPAEFVVVKISQKAGQAS